MSFANKNVEKDAHDTNAVCGFDMVGNIGRIGYLPVLNKEMEELL